MTRMYAHFEDLPIGTIYHSNGNTWRKRSTRTADLIGYNRWFYWGKKELAIVGEYSKL